MKTKNIKVSFDFDSTLSRKDVQSFAKELISKGISVNNTSSWKVKCLRILNKK